MPTWFQNERFIHSTKTAIACMAGFGLARYVGLPVDQWVVITIIVLMCAQIYVGSVMQKAIWRFLGTLTGCLIAALTLIVAGPTPLAIGIAIGIASFLFSYIAVSTENLTYACTLGAVTTALILLAADPTLLYALERFLEISIGILIATVVSQFVLPIHARTHLRAAQAETLGMLRDYYLATMTTIKTTANTVDYQELDELIVKSLLKQRQLGKESLREPLGTSFNAARFMRMLYCEREMLRSITFMHQALLQVKNTDALFLQSPALQAFNDGIVQTLNTLIAVIETDKPAPDLTDIPTLTAVKAELQKNATADNRLYIDGFLFCAEILTNRLGQLIPG